MTRKRLLCSVGNPSRGYSEATYRWASALPIRCHTTRFSPVALARLLDLQGACASVLVTPVAKSNWYEAIAAELRQAGLESQAVEVPEVTSERDIMATFQRVIEAVSPGETVVLDVTLGLRHMPFVYFTALAFLTALRDVQLEGIYYGAFDLQSEDGAVPIVDVTSLFQLSQWYHAVQTAREIGDLRAIASALQRDVASLFRRGGRDTFLSQASGLAQKLAQDLAAVLPLEIGLRATALQQALEQLASAEPALSPSRLALGELQTQVTALAVPGGTTAKAHILLGKAELERQLTLVNRYAGQGAIPSALLVLREWMVNLILWHRGVGDARWLERPRRQRGEESLNALSYRAQHQLATQAEKEVGSVWDSVANLRNAYAHAGMRSDEVRPSPEKVLGMIQQCRKLLASTTILQEVPERRGGRLLVTPLGLTPGVIYTALLQLQPARAIVVTSEKASKALPTALERARAQGVPYLLRKVEDPFLGYQEADRVLDSEVRSWLVKAEEVVVNLAGGTTVMQYIVERLAHETKRLGIPTRRGATVDRRTPQEQRSKPYVPGEWVELVGSDEDQAGEKDMADVS